MSTLKIVKLYDFEKTGVDEIQGLKDALTELLKPVRAHLLESVYWNDCAIEATEYKSRAGFIPYDENCGGAEISLVIPSCEQGEFSFLEFGECEDCAAITDLDEHGSPKRCGFDGQECSAENDGHLDAKLRVWLKFEGLEDGTMSFWLYAGGGNGDAPYFRTAHEATVFETSFTAATLAGVRRQGVAAVKKLLKSLK